MLGVTIAKITTLITNNLRWTYKMKKIILALTALTSLNSLAWDGVAKDRIGSIQVTEANNAAFRIGFESGKTFCGTHTWSYLNKTDSNYETYVSVLLAAKMSGKEVTVYTAKKGDYGFCNIGHIELH